MLLRIITIRMVSITGGVGGARSGGLCVGALVLTHLTEDCRASSGVRHQHTSYWPARRWNEVIYKAVG